MGVNFDYSIINEWEDALILEIPLDFDFELDSDGRKIKRGIMKRVRDSRRIIKIFNAIKNYILK